MYNFIIVLGVEEAFLNTSYVFKNLKELLKLANTATKIQLKKELYVKFIELENANLTNTVGVVAS